MKFLMWSFLFFALFFGAEKWLTSAGGDEETRILVDVNRSKGRLAQLWRPGANITGLGAGSQYNPKYSSILRPDEFRGELPHPDVLQKWNREIGFEGGIFRIFFDLLTYNKEAFPSEKDRAILDTYEAIIRAVIDGGGTPLLTFTSTPYSISVNPTRRGRPTYPPKDYEAWTQYVIDVVRYFSIEKELGEIWYHIWHEPNTSLWENQYQKGLYKDKFPGKHVTKYWKGTREQFFNLYKAAVEGIESVERTYNVSLKVGGVNIQMLDRWEMGDPNGFPESFVKYCHTNELRMDFFSYRIVHEDVNQWSKHFRGLLDRNGYHETKLIVVDWTTGGLVVGKNAIGGTYKGIERDCEIQAARIPALIAEMEEAGVDRQGMETMQDWDGQKYLHGYPLFKKQLGTAFTVGNIIKPAFNVCKMLSLLGEERLGTRVEGAENIGVVATRSDRELAVLFWYYVEPSEISRGAIDIKELRDKVPKQDVMVEVKGLQKGERLRYRRFLVDYVHSNSFFHKESILRALLGMEKDESIEKSKLARLKNFARLPKEKIQKNSAGINGWEEINLQKVEEKDIFVGDRVEKNISMEPFSVHLIIIDLE